MDGTPLVPDNPTPTRLLPVDPPAPGPASRVYGVNQQQKAHNVGRDVNFNSGGPTALYVVLGMAVLVIGAVAGLIIYQSKSSPVERESPTANTAPPPKPTAEPPRPTATVNAPVPTPVVRPVAHATPGPTGAPLASPPRTPSSQSKRFVVSGFLATDVCVKPGDRIEIRAGGVIVLGSYVGRSGPAGRDTWEGLPAPIDRRYRKQQEFRVGALLFRFKGESRWRLVGEGTELATPRAGCLEFEINDAEPENNSGAFNVEVTVTK
jgi:hypothetical protein